MNQPHYYQSRAEAQNAITALETGIYYLAHGEYARPKYTARKERNGERFYVHARYYYYAGTFYARQPGALTYEDLHTAYDMA